MRDTMMYAVTAALIGSAALIAAATVRVSQSSTVVVTHTRATGVGSLADAISRANVQGGRTRITFAIPESDPGFDPDHRTWRIAVEEALPPVLAEGTIIDGASQRKALGQAGAKGPAIELVGRERRLDTGIALVGPRCRVSGVSIGGFKHGVVLYGSASIGNEVKDCRIGVRADGRTALPNDAGVIVVEGARDNVLSDCQVSGNAALGVYIHGRETTGNSLVRNKIGTDASGLLPVPNALGVMISRSGKNQIGEAGAGNLISGNANVGVLMVGKWTEENTVCGNLIGTGADGQKPLPNNIGIVIKSLAHRNSIGGAAKGDGNVISGNVQIGVYIEAANENVLYGNLIGTDPSGTRIVASGDIVQGNGIEFDTAAKGNILGGDRPGERNVISGHKVYGVIYYGNCKRNATIGNYIGTDITGTRPLPNATGICVDCAAHANLIARNVISGNMSYGLFFVTRGTENNTLVGNRIGTTAAGDAALPNDVGMCISTGACRNRVGGTRPEDANVISGNAQAGLMITNQGTAENVIEGNVIGLDAHGTRAIPNKLGVLFSTYPERNVVRGNTISGNAAVGVLLYEYASRNLVTGNRIGLAVPTDAAAPNGIGVLIDHWSSGNRVGTPESPNIVRHNLAGGIIVTADVGEGNEVGANLVSDNAGTNAAVAKRVEDAVAARAERELPTPPEQPIPARAALIGTAPTKAAPGMSRRSFDVTTTNETGPGSFTAALAACNAAGGQAVIRFNIPRNDRGFDPKTGTWRIRLTDTPPALVVSEVLIDGWTQTLAQGDTNAAGPEIVLDGSNHTVEHGVLISGASNCTIRGLVIGGFVVGVQVNGVRASGNRICGCYVGVGPDGSSLFGNYNGIEITSGANGNLIGGADRTEANIVSGNEHAGIRITDASDNTVVRNLIGTDRTGQRAVRNYDGVTIEGQSHGNVIGGATPNERNICSGNVAYGVDLFGWGVTGNRVVGNYIGTDVTGSRPVPNTYGVLFDDRSHHNTVGGDAPGEGNVISGNTAFGAYFYNNGTHTNAFVGNLIGTDASGRYALPNETGVHIDGGTTDNRVDRNVISANRVAGITIFSIKTDRNSITRNLIGTDITGEGALGNGSDGIRIVFGAQDNTIGGKPEDANIIAHNGRAGVAVESAGSKRNRIVCNSIYANAGLGIDLFPIGPNDGLAMLPSDVPNRGMRAPVIRAAQVAGDELVIEGSIPGDRAAGITVQVYSGAPGP